MITFHVEGFRELDAALGELPKATAKNAMRRVLLKAGEPIAEAASARAPVDTGLMKRRITVSTKLSKRQRRLNNKSDEKSFTEVYVGPPSSSDITRMQEFGTRNSPPLGFIRGGFDSGQGKALEIIKAELRGEIDKAVVRLARKQARLIAKTGG